MRNTSRYCHFHVYYLPKLLSDKIKVLNNPNIKTKYSPHTRIHKSIKIIKILFKEKKKQVSKQVILFQEIERFKISINSLRWRGRLSQCSYMAVNLAKKKKTNKTTCTYIYIWTMKGFILLLLFLTVYTHHFYLADILTIFKRSVQPLTRPNNSQ